MMPDQIVNFIQGHKDDFLDCVRQRLVEQAIPVSELRMEYVRNSIFEVICKSLAVHPEKSWQFGMAVCFDSCQNPQDLIAMLDPLAEKLRELHFRKCEYEPIPGPRAM